MVTTVQKSNTVAFPSRTAINSSSERRVDLRQYAELRLQLSNSLQTTLDLSTLLDLFFDQISGTLAIDSLSYENEKLAQALDQGTLADNRCDYKLLTDQDNLGHINFSRRKRFAEHELELLEIMISSLICPLRNALMYREAVQAALRDPLTGTGNRMALENALEREVALAKRNKLPLTLVIVDIDKFKEINDQHGHAVGDIVLKNVAKQLGHSSRETDSAYRAYRFGGEEFVVVLNNTNLTGGIIVAERIRQSIEQLSTHHQNSDINATVSVGIAALSDDEVVADLFSRADRALYQAKAEGRNRVIVSK
jgi:diguanylate cyclase (GGDEF)-like protein